MTTKHTPTPWYRRGRTIHFGNTRADHRFIVVDQSAKEDDLDRIVQCVNACAEDGDVIKALRMTVAAENYDTIEEAKEACAQVLRALGG